jgi:hypothetical protein
VIPNQLLRSLIFSNIESQGVGGIFTGVTFYRQRRDLPNDDGKNEENRCPVAGLVAAIGIESCQDAFEYETGETSNVSSN